MSSRLTKSTLFFKALYIIPLLTADEDEDIDSGIVRCSCNPAVLVEEEQDLDIKINSRLRRGKGALPRSPNVRLLRGLEPVQRIAI